MVMPENVAQSFFFSTPNVNAGILCIYTERYNTTASLGALTNCLGGVARCLGYMQRAHGGLTGKSVTKNLFSDKQR